MQSSPGRIALLFLVLTLVVGECCISQHLPRWTDTFPEDSTRFSPQGSNPYLILEPGYQLQLKGKEGGKSVNLTITVLNETTTIDGTETRIVEERETADGELVEVSRNFFAISTRTNNVYYFGEDVDMYKNGKVVGHEGSWHSGVNGARYGLLIPGVPLLGSRYYQEVAPEVAMDRAEIISLNERIETRAGTYEKCLKTEETTPLEPKAKEYKCYAKGIGLVRDGELSLVAHGFLAK